VRIDLVELGDWILHKTNLSACVLIRLGVKLNDLETLKPCDY
jgi:hypothetical protein